MAKQGRRTGRLAVAMLALVLPGAVFVGYLWETLNRLFSGTVEPVRLLISTPIALLFWLLLRWIARSVERWQAEHSS